MVTCNDIRFEAIAEEHYDDVIVHLRNNFFYDEPLNRSMNLCQPGESHKDLEDHSLITLRDGLSQMAVSGNGEIAGVALNGIQRKDDLNSAEDKLNKLTDEKFGKIIGLLHAVNKSLDLFTRYGVDAIFECRILSVDSKYRGQGLAQELLKRSVEVASNSGFRVVKEDATGKYSQRVAEKIGFKTVHTLEYTSVRGDDGEILFKIPPPHDCLKILVKIADDV